MSVRNKDEDGGIHDYDLREVQEIANKGRRLAIYDRATGLYAYWYLQLRAAEEISRSQRHHRGVFCISIWTSAAQESVDAMRDRLKSGLRDHDLAAYLNNGHFVALLTETDAAGAHIVLSRLLAAAEGVTGGLASYPEDGETFEELLESAKARGAGPAERAA
jgi:GGDEF domain-containing protein